MFNQAIDLTVLPGTNMSRIVSNLLSMQALPPHLSLIVLATSSSCRGAQDVLIPRLIVFSAVAPQHHTRGHSLLIARLTTYFIAHNRCLACLPVGLLL